jgi:hypothetical protein
MPADAPKPAKIAAATAVFRIALVAVDTNIVTSSVSLLGFFQRYAPPAMLSNHDPFGLRPPLA